MVSGTVSMVHRTNKSFKETVSIVMSVNGHIVVQNRNNRQEVEEVRKKAPAMSMFSLTDLPIADNTPLYHLSHPAPKRPNFPSSSSWTKATTPSSRPTSGCTSTSATMSTLGCYSKTREVSRRTRRFMCRCRGRVARRLRSLCIPSRRVLSSRRKMSKGTRVRYLTSK